MEKDRREQSVIIQLRLHFLFLPPRSQSQHTLLHIKVNF